MEPITGIRKGLPGMAPILRLRVDHANGCTVGVLAERPRAQHAILTPTQPQRVHARNVLAHVRQAGGLGGVRCGEARGPPRSAVEARLVCLGPEWAASVCGTCHSRHPVALHPHASFT